MNSFKKSQSRRGTGVEGHSITVSGLFGGKDHPNIVAYRRLKAMQGIKRCSECGKEAKWHGVCSKACSDFRKVRQSKSSQDPIW